MNDEVYFGNTGGAPMGRGRRPAPRASPEESGLESPIRGISVIDKPVISLHNGIYDVHDCRLARVVAQ